MSPTLTILEPGLLTTVQDSGRPGRAASGVGPSGACDLASYRLANRLVGNAEDAPALEVTHGGLRVRADGDVVLATTGARCTGSGHHNAPTTLRSGDLLELGPPTSGLRTYVAVRGGVVVEPVLGSCATDTLSGLGPGALAAGDVLGVGNAGRPMPGVDLAPVTDPEVGVVEVQVTPGPRRDWFPDRAWRSLLEQTWTVTSDSNRVGLRLEGEALGRDRTDELPSEGLVRGALQVPPSGKPVLFLADHPVTGGYPVIAYVTDTDVDRCAQLRPGQGLLLLETRASRVTHDWTAVTRWRPTASPREGGVSPLQGDQGDVRPTRSARGCCPARSRQIRRAPVRHRFHDQHLRGSAGSTDLRRRPREHRGRDSGGRPGQGAQGLLERRQQRRPSNGTASPAAVIRVPLTSAVLWRSRRRPAATTRSSTG